MEIALGANEDNVKFLRQIGVMAVENRLRSLVHRIATTEEPRKTVVSNAWSSRSMDASTPTLRRKAKKLQRSRIQEYRWRLRDDWSEMEHEVHIPDKVISTSLRGALRKLRANLLRRRINLDVHHKRQGEWDIFNLQKELRGCV
eukprot:GEMP01112429.1.p1 GENE.GEMP01112429.1~~GEMP01112429.1.p1  ORF type:complete len:153 (+),score=27.39 GEMP01112429.1:30-461(+)